ncbi:unnamed protein product [Symbiodinium sp. CCMP2592]|nr:unnamed protein product [Symbiodinium sp. CCMP2592]CAE7373746.1 unnamed protein product [Symbiodinium sp. CCMP2592]
MIQTSELGPVHWATQKTNLGARGPASQAMQRALKHRPDVKELYQVLLDSEKTAFRAAWTCSRDFAFTSSKRTTSNVFRKRKEDVGVFKTQLQLEAILGGSHQPEAVMQAKNYMSMCLRNDLKEYCYMFNDWLKAPTYLWVESLVSSMSETTWKNEVTVEVQDEPIVGSWAYKAQFCKAARCYAVEKGLYAKDVTREMIEATDLGVRGYAELYASTPAALPQPGGDGSASKTAPKPGGPIPTPSPAPAPKAKGKPGKTEKATLEAMVGQGKVEGNDETGQPETKKPRKGGAGGNVTSKKERELKEFLALEAQSDNCMTAIAADMSANPAAWSWAKDFVQQYKSLRTEIVQLYADTEFFKEAKIGGAFTVDAEQEPEDAGYREAGLPKERIIPVAVYFDGVQYTKNENFLGFYVTNLRTKRQQLVWLLRLSELCSCGCRGWCSVFPLLDHFRRDMCAPHKDLRSCIIDYKADWPAYIELCGFRTWSHNKHPCPLCTVNQTNMRALGTMTLHSCPHSLFDQTAYEELLAATFREIFVPDEDTKLRINAQLRYRRPGRGRCLKQNIPLLGLRKGWRLEPSSSLPDVDDFAKQRCPFSCVFYTGGKDGRVLHLSPFLQIPGVTMNTWCVDVLHTWHYGPMSTFIAHSLRHLLRSPVYRPSASDLDKEEADKLALLTLRAELWSYYKRRRENDEDGMWRKKGTEVWNLSLTMLAGKYLKAKAAETHGLLGFVVDRLEKHAHVLLSAEHANTCDFLLRAGRAAMDFDAVMANGPRAIDERFCGMLFDHYNRFICLCERAGVALLPKCHMMYHMIQRAVQKGNPRMYSTYIDESLNGLIAQICRSVHRRGWALEVYRKLAMMECFQQEANDR